MKHELEKEWVKPELKKISFAGTNETVLSASGWNSSQDYESPPPPPSQP